MKSDERLSMFDFKDGEVYCDSLGAIYYRKGKNLYRFSPQVECWIPEQINNCSFCHMDKECLKDHFASRFTDQYKDVVEKHGEAALYSKARLEEAVTEYADIEKRVLKILSFVNPLKKKRGGK